MINQWEILTFFGQNSITFDREVAGDDYAGQNLRKSTKKIYFVQMVNGGPPRPTKINILIKTI